MMERIRSEREEREKGKRKQDSSKGPGMYASLQGDYDEYLPG